MLLAHRSLTLIAAFAATLGLGIGMGIAPLAREGTVMTTAAASPGPTPAVGTRTIYPVNVVRVIDGDTFEARVRAWPGMEIATKVRLRDIDAPELRARCDAERIQARAAGEALTAMLADGEVTIGQVSFDKYGGRVLAAAYTPRTGDVAAALLERGLVRRYAGRRESWC